MTSREAATIACGEDAVLAYERVKTFYTRFGKALQDAFADAVGGKSYHGVKGRADVESRRGEFEFCAQANTKNSAGEAAQRALGRVIVQVNGTPRPGRISGVEFLRMHGVPDPARAAGACEVRALNAAKPPPEPERLF